MNQARESSRRLAVLLRCEQGAMADFLVALAEFDRQRLWIQLGHASVFYYLHRDLKLSKGAAHYRKVAAQLIQRFPEVVAPFREGKLCISSVVELARVITPENSEEVLPRFFYLSKQEAKAVAVEICPASVVPRREVVTEVVTEVGGGDGGASRGSVSPGSRPDTSVTVRPETWVTVSAHALDRNRSDERTTPIRIGAAQAQVHVQQPVRGLRRGAEDWVQVVAPVRGLRSRWAAGPLPPREEPWPHPRCGAAGGVVPRRGKVHVAPRFRRHLRLDAAPRDRPRRPAWQGRPIDGRRVQIALRRPQPARRSPGLRRRLDGPVHQRCGKERAGGAGSGGGLFVGKVRLSVREAGRAPGRRRR
jgi:hypothetical protein